MERAAAAITTPGGTAKRLRVVATAPSGTPKSSDPVELAAGEIGHLARVSPMHLALDIGAIILTRIYGGNIDLLRQKGPKDVSFRRLAEHKGHGMSAIALWRAVAIFEIALRCPELRDSRHLGVTHVRQVLGLGPRTQEKVLARAEGERWSAEKLTAHAKTKRHGRGGRPRKPEILRALDSLRRVAALQLEHFSNKQVLDKLSAEEAEVHLVTLAELGERLGELERALRGIAARG